MLNEFLLFLTLTVMTAPSEPPAGMASAGGCGGISPELYVMELPPEPESAA